MTDIAVTHARLPGADGLTLAVDILGPSDGPPALLLHGMGQTRHSWGQSAAALAGRGWRVYMVDHRGHGDSDWPQAADYDHLHWARDIIALCGELDSRPLVIGASLGGMCSLVAQREVAYPLFSGVVLVDIAPDLDMDGGKRIMNFMNSNAGGFADLDEAAAVIGAYRGGERKPSPSGLQRVLRQRDDGRWYWHWDPRILEGRVRWINDPEAAAQYGERIRSAMVAGGQQPLDH